MNPFYLMAQGSDDASDVAYNSGWNNGTNGGTGFSSWTLTNGGNSGFFVGSSDINVSGESWGTYANNGDVASAVRDFSTAMESSDGFEVYIDNGSIQNGGTIGFGLQNSNGDNLMEFFFRGGESNYEVNDNNGVVATNTGFTSNGLRVEVFLTSATQFDIKITPIGGSTETILGKTLRANANQSISKLRLFNANAGAGSGADCFFNSIAHIPNALSVEFNSFQARKYSNGTMLEWETVAETNNSHFEIERSSDSRTWEEIGKVDGNGDSFEKLVYTFTDKEPHGGLNYYRLKQVDFDGSYTFSEIISIEFRKHSSVSIYPNPVKDVLTVSGADKLNYNAEIYDLNGRIIKNGILNSENTSLDMTGILQGVYLLRIIDEAGFVIDSQRIIKL